MFGQHFSHAGLFTELSYMIWSITMNNTGIWTSHFTFCRSLNYVQHRDWRRRRIGGAEDNILTFKKGRRGVQNSNKSCYSQSRLLKCKGVPLQARCGPEGSRRFRLPDFHDIRHMKVVRLSASRTGRRYTRECSWYSFSLGAESTPGPWCGQKEICHWKIQWHHRESIPGPSD